MEAVLPHAAARRRARPTWWQAVCAAVAGSIVGFGAVFVALLAFMFWLPIQLTDGMTGRGWPWRIEGPWSFVADVGPLLFCGAAFAFGAELSISRHTGVACWRWPIALVAAVVGWVTLGGISHAGLLELNALPAFLMIVAAVRETSVRERRAMRWTRARATAVAGVVFMLAVASISYGLLHPLTAASDESGMPTGSAMRFTAFIHNEGDGEVTLVSVSVPGIEFRRAWIFDESGQSTATIDEQMRPVGGATIAGNWSRDVYFELPRCTSAVIDRLDVRLRVHGRNIDQVVRLAPPVRLTCP
jgi:hypothetical protein